MLVESSGLADGVLETKKKVDAAASTIEDLDKANKIQTISTSGASIVGGVMTCIPPVSAIGAGISLVSSAGQVTASVTLEMNIRSTYNEAVENSKPMCDKVSAYSTSVEKTQQLRDDAANVWGTSPNDTNDLAIKVIVAFKVLHQLSERNGFNETITAADCFRAALMLFYP